MANMYKARMVETRNNLIRKDEEIKHRVECMENNLQRITDKVGKERVRGEIEVLKEYLSNPKILQELNLYNYSPENNLRRRVLRWIRGELI